MKVTISSTHVDEKQWAKEGRSGVIRTQEATAECSKFRQRIRLDLGKDQAFPVGEYTVDLEDAISVGDFGDLKLARRLPLRAVEQPKPAVKAA